MAATEEQYARSGFSRRDALRMLAASTGTVAAASAIVSQPALAANGSEGCSYTFTGDPQVTVGVANVPGGGKDVLNISVSVTGRCPCENGNATIEYAYHIVTRSSATGSITASGGTGWRTGWNEVSVSSPTVLWPNGRGGNPDGAVTVAVGVRVTCPVESGNTTACRSASQTFTIRNPSDSFTKALSLGSDSTTSPLPPCEPSVLGRSAAPLLDSSGTVVFTPGKQAMPTIDSTIEEPAVDLGPAEPAPDTTASTTTTTTTTEPSAPTESTTSTSSTSTTSTSTTSTSSTPELTSDE